MELASCCIRVVTSLLVPADLSFEALLLADLHAEHLGMVKMKQLVRKYFWWPELFFFQGNLDNKPQFTPNQAVFVRNFGKGAKWIPGTIVGTVSPRNFEVQSETLSGNDIKNNYVHDSYLHTRVRVSSCAPATWANWRVDPVVRERPVTTPTLSQPKEATPVLDTPALDSMADAFSSPQDSSVQDSELQASAPEQPERRYPLRERKPPQRFF